MSKQKIDSAIITGYICLTGVIIFMYCFGSYIHYQFSSAVDCSLLTEPSIYEDKNSNIGMRYPGQTLTVQQTRDLCFDGSMIHKGELCYYISCGTDVNQTVNYDGQQIKQSLTEPTKLHIYPKPNEKFTIFDVAVYDVMIAVLLFMPLLIIGLGFYRFRNCQLGGSRQNSCTCKPSAHLGNFISTGTNEDLRNETQTTNKFRQNSANCKKTKLVRYGSSSNHCITFFGGYRRANSLSSSFRT